MTHGAKFLLAFFRFRGGRAGQCWWRQGNIARELGCHRSSVVRWVAELVDAGEIDSVRRGHGNLYTLRKSCSKQRRLPLENATSDVVECDIEAVSSSLVKYPEKEKQARKSKSFKPLTEEEIEHPAARRYLQPHGPFRSRMKRAESPERYQAAVVRRAIAEWVERARELERSKPESVSQEIPTWSAADIERHRIEPIAPKPTPKDDGYFKIPAHWKREAVGSANESHDMARSCEPGGISGFAASCDSLADQPIEKHVTLRKPVEMAFMSSGARSATHEARAG